MVSPIERIRGVNDQIAAIDAAIGQARAEAEMLQHIADDAQRDALVSDRYEDRSEARRTMSDVQRIRKHVLDLERDRARLATKRDRMIERLSS